MPSLFFCNRHGLVWSSSVRFGFVLESLPSVEYSSPKHSAIVGRFCPSLIFVYVVIVYGSRVQMLAIS